MAENKYYWLKLKKDFFKRHDIQIVEAMPNGKDYVLFYLKLLVESLDHNGELRFSETIPYNDEMLSTITHTNIDIVHSAMSIFQQLELVEILDDSTIFMQEVEKMVGSETNEYIREQNRIRQQRFRENKKLENERKALCNVTVTLNRNAEKELEKEKEIELEKEYICEKPKRHKYGEYKNVLLTDEEVNKLQDLLGNQYSDFIERLSSYMASTGKKYKSHYVTILNWHKKDQEKNKPQNKNAFIDEW